MAINISYKTTLTPCGHILLLCAGGGNYACHLECEGVPRRGLTITAQGEPHTSCLNLRLPRYQKVLARDGGQCLLQLW